MNIIQLSAPKSGSFWLHTMLQKLLVKKGLPISSFITKQPVYEKLKQRSLSFQDQVKVDMIDIEDDGVFYRVSSIIKEPVSDLEAYTRNSSLTWTHSSFCSTSQRVLQQFDKKIYIIRDPRDRALSAARFAFTPYMMKHWPSSYNSPQAYFDGEFQRLVHQWVWHVGQYLLHIESLGLHVVFYERLLHDFPAEFQRILDYLGFSLSYPEKKAFEQEVQFRTMKNSAPNHLQKGRSGGWKKELTSPQKQMVQQEAGDLMELLGYPIQEEKAKDLPLLKNNLSKNHLKQILSGIPWQELFPESI